LPLLRHSRPRRRTARFDPKRT